ncbi:hypothetical protein ACET3X_009634 [Alternaria dauci]|uniref:Uncharacterized protein n=1 Tax=Alternaria dauci TaxID=48095 RepID=A0ABR3U668_9PLEO
MSGSQNYPTRTSGASRRNSGGGGGGGSSRRNSHQSSASGVPALTSPPQVSTYDPSRDPTYTQVHRSSGLVQVYQNGVTNNQGSNAAPYQTHPQNQTLSPYNPPHQSWTAYSSTHLQITTHDTSVGSFNASRAFQATSPAGGFAQPHQVPTGGVHPNQTAQRPRPYDAVGYIRSDGEVYDKDEVYEEYRPYDPYAR